MSARKKDCGWEARLDTRRLHRPHGGEKLRYDSKSLCHHGDGVPEDGRGRSLKRNKETEKNQPVEMEFKLFLLKEELTINSSSF